MQINVKKQTPANQNESNSSLINTVHGTHMMLLVFLDIRSRGSFTYKMLSNDTVDPNLN